MYSKTQLEMKAARALAIKDYRRATKHLRALLSLVGENPYTLYMIAECYEHQGDLSDATAYANEVLAIEPGHFETLKLLARIYVREGNHYLAYEYVGKGLANIPSPIRRDGLFHRVRKFLDILPEKEQEPDGLSRLDRKDREWVEWARKFAERYEERLDDCNQ